MVVVELTFTSKPGSGTTVLNGNDTFRWARCVAVSVPVYSR
jgi:hypothetical protein